MGRPSKFSPELLSTICDRLSTGEPLTHVCRDLGVAPRTVRDWESRDENVSAAIACAREDGENAMAEDCLRIADDKAGDVQRDKLRVDTRLKLLAKFNPKRWGDKVQHADADGDKLPSAIRIELVRPGE